MLSKKEWTQKYVYKWQGLRNSDTGKIEYGYLFLWNEDHTKATGHPTYTNSRAKAIHKHYTYWAAQQAGVKIVDHP